MPPSRSIRRLSPPLQSERPLFLYWLENPLEGAMDRAVTGPRSVYAGVPEISDLANLETQTGPNELVE